MAREWHGSLPPWRTNVGIGSPLAFLQAGFTFGSSWLVITLKSGAQPTRRAYTSFPAEIFAPLTLRDPTPATIFD